MQRRAIALFTPSIHDMMEVARLADDAGFDSVWNGEFFNRNGLVTLAAVALATPSEPKSPRASPTPTCGILY